MTNDLDVDKSAWVSCPSGELQRAQNRMALRERRRHVAQLSAAAVCVIVLVAVGVQARSIAWNPSSPHAEGELTCTDVQQLAHAGPARLDSLTRAKVAAHLGACPHCATQTAALFAQRKKPRTEASAALEHCAGDGCKSGSKSHCD